MGLLGGRSDSAIKCLKLLIKFRFFILILVIARVIKRLSIHKPLLLFNSYYRYVLYNIYNLTVFTTCALYQCAGVFWQLTSCPRPVAPESRLMLEGKLCSTSHEDYAHTCRLIQVSYASPMWTMATTC